MHDEVSSVIKWCWSSVFSVVSLRLMTSECICSNSMKFSILCFAFVFFCATDMVCCGVPLRGMTSGCICCFKVGFNLSSLFVVLCCWRTWWCSQYTVVHCWWDDKEVHLLPRTWTQRQGLKDHSRQWWWWWWWWWRWWWWWWRCWRWFGDAADFDDAKNYL